MTLSRAIIARLIADASVAARCGTRIYLAGEVPQDSDLPIVVVERISSVPLRTFAGRANTYTDRWQVAIHDDDPDDALTGSTEIDTSLAGWTRTDAEPYVSSSHRVMEVSDFEPPQDSSALGVWRVIQDYEIWYSLD